MTMKRLCAPGRGRQAGETTARFRAVLHLALLVSVLQHSTADLGFGIENKGTRPPAGLRGRFAAYRTPVRGGLQGFRGGGVLRHTREGRVSRTCATLVRALLSRRCHSVASLPGGGIHAARTCSPTLARGAVRAQPACDVSSTTTTRTPAFAGAVHGGGGGGSAAAQGRHAHQAGAACARTRTRAH